MGQVLHPRHINLHLSKLYPQIRRFGHDLGAAKQAVVPLNRRESEIEAQREGDREKQEGAKSGFAAAIHVSAFNRLLVDVPPV